MSEYVCVSACVRVCVCACVCVFVCVHVCCAWMTMHIIAPQQRPKPDYISILFSYLFCMQEQQHCFANRCCNTFWGKGKKSITQGRATYSNCVCLVLLVWPLVILHAPSVYWGRYFVRSSGERIEELYNKYFCGFHIFFFVFLSSILCLLKREIVCEYVCVFLRECVWEREVCGGKGVTI